MNVTEVPAQIALQDWQQLTPPGTLGLTVIVMLFDAAGEPLTQGALDVICTFMSSPFARAAEIYVADVAPGIRAAPLYHWYVGAAPPFVGVAVNVTEVPAQIAPAGLAAILTLAGTLGLTVIVMLFDAAGEPLTQGALDVICTLMSSPFARAAEIYVADVAPGIRAAPLYHWYVGAAPPFVGVAVNVTEVPAQIAPAGLAAILTLAGTLGLTVIVMLFDAAGEPLTQGALDVICTFMSSPFARAAEIYVADVAPGIRAAPLYHWYVGAAPPFVGVAVNVTEVPAQIAPQDWQQY
ncbi:MAG: hypothetical protein IPN67_13185 [Bacteroidales bacterium]|nr:hypothetical protein [Bacteroidales bacterium]